MVLQGQETEYQTPADRTPALGHLSCRKSLRGALDWFLRLENISNPTGAPL